jgi:hypothetical protein
MDIEQQEEQAKQQAKQKLKAQALQQHGRIHQKQEVSISRSPANQVIAQQLAAAVLEKRLAVEEGSHKARTSSSPVTANAKQALALMVSSRLQVCWVAMSACSMPVFHGRLWFLSASIFKFLIC